MGKHNVRAVVRAGFVATVASVVLASSVGAHASGTVSVGKIPTQKVAYKAKATVTPQVTTRGNVKVLAKTLTVKAKGKTVARSVKSARLKASRYNVVTKVKYQTFTWVSGIELLRDTGAALAPSVGGGLGFGECAVVSVADAGDFEASCALVGAHEKRLTVTSAHLVGDFGQVSVAQVITPERLTLPHPIHRDVRWREFSATRTATRSQTLTVKQGPKPASCASPARFKKVKKRMTVAQVKVLLGKSKVQAKAGDLVNREYKPCKRTYYVIVTFEDGKVFEKTLYKL
jgi:hypothetical protein